MLAKRLRHCLIGSTLLHIALFVAVTRMSPTTHVTMREVEVFIIESPVANLSEPKRLITPSFGTDIHRNAPKMGQFQPVRQAGRSASPLPDQNAVTKAFPSIAQPDLTTLQPEQSKAPASVALNTAPISPLATRSQDENSGRTSSISSRQSSGSGQVMVLGDVGSPRFIHKELPIYPFVARKLGKEGKVVLRLALDAQGQLQGIVTVEAIGFGFAEAASAAIRKSTFAPAVKNGRAISSQVLVPIRFVLHEGQ